MSTNRITAQDVADMTRHWLGCPPNGYLGMGYGSEVKSLLQTPMAAGLADALISKLREDVPLVQALSDSAVNVYSYDKSMDQKVIAVEINGQFIEATGQTFAAQGAGIDNIDRATQSLVAGLTEAGIEKLHKHIHVTLPSNNYF